MASLKGEKITERMGFKQQKLRLIMSEWVTVIDIGVD